MKNVFSEYRSQVSAIIWFLRETLEDSVNYGKWQWRLTQSGPTAWVSLNRLLLLALSPVELLASLLIALVVFTLATAGIICALFVLITKTLSLASSKIKEYIVNRVS